ncbi:g8698 [Coccomyxa viridis]|uniref:G8698 protein n=1 Tax=Coccomyxa viridis TaxID=1274662 RepID=A0ABP1G239_9CHLO
MNFVQERLAKADTQYSNLVEQLENARDKWLKEKDPASQAKLKTVYDDIMSMVDCTSTRIMHLETGSYRYGATQWDEPKAFQAFKLTGPFVPSATFVGAAAGYVFKLGPKGLGYYLDTASGGGADMGYKRKMEDEILRPVRRAPKYGRFVDAPMFGKTPPNQRGPSDNVTTVAGAAPLRGRGASSPSLEIAD